MCIIVKCGRADKGGPGLGVGSRLAGEGKESNGVWSETLIYIILLCQVRGDYVGDPNPSILTKSLFSIVVSKIRRSLFVFLSLSLSLSGESEI